MKAEDTSRRSGGAVTRSFETVLFADACAVLDKLSDPFKTPFAKLELFSRYLRKFSCASVIELYPVLRLFIPALDRKRSPSGLRQPLLARVYAEVFALPPAAAARLRLFKDPVAAGLSASDGAKTGDFGSFVAAVVKKRVAKQRPVVNLQHLNEQLDLVCLALNLSEKLAILQELLPKLTIPEHKWCMRILMKDVKLGGLGGERLLTVLHFDARRILNQSSDLHSTLEAIDEIQQAAASKESVTGAFPAYVFNSGTQQGKAQPHHNHDREGYPFFRSIRPMLAKFIRPTTDDIQRELFAFSKKGRSANEAKRNDSGNFSYIIERKYDGERILAHVDLRRGSSYGAADPQQSCILQIASPSLPRCVRLFSRRGQDYSLFYGQSDSLQQSAESRNSVSYTVAAADAQERRYRPTPTSFESMEAETLVQGRASLNQEGMPAENALRSLTATLAEALIGSQAIFDGELLAWDDDTKTFLPFGTNKAVAVSETKSCHLSYVVFDILFYRNTDGKAYSLLRMQLKNRKALLMRVLRPKGNRIILAPYVEASTPAEIVRRFNAAVKQRHEGIVVKSASSYYELNSRLGGWYKIKPASGNLPDTLDLIVIGAFFADTTRRREHASSHPIDHCSHFLVGVLEGAGGPAAMRVRSFCRVGSGFSQSMLSQMRDFVRPYCERLWKGDRCSIEESILPYWMQGCRMTASCRVDVTWPPSKSFVMEVTAADVIPSAEFDVKYTLRFATATKPLRRDKAWHEALSEIELQAFFSEAKERGGKGLFFAIDSPLDSPHRLPRTSLVIDEQRRACDRQAEYDERDKSSATDVDDFTFLQSEKTPHENLSNANLVPTCGSLAPACAEYSTSRMYGSDNTMSTFDQPSHRNFLRCSSRATNRANVQHSSCNLPRMHVLQRFRPSTTNAVNSQSAALRGMCVWVMDGAENDLPDLSTNQSSTGNESTGVKNGSKDALAHLIVSHGGQVASGLTKSVTHIIAARPTFRTEAAAAFAASLAAAGRVKSSTNKGHTVDEEVLSQFPNETPPVLHYRWLLDCAKANTLLPIKPSDVIHGTVKTARDFAGRFDRYGDAFFLPDASPTLLLSLIENANRCFNASRGAETKLSFIRPNQPFFKFSETYSMATGEKQQPTEKKVTLADKEALFKEIANKQAESSLKLFPLKCVRLYVPPTDIVWEFPCELVPLKLFKAQQPPYEYLKIKLRNTSSPSSSSDQKRTCAVQSLTERLRKAKRSSIVARCCLLGTRLAPNLSAATHVLLPDPPFSTTPSNKSTTQAIAGGAEIHSRWIPNYEAKTCLPRQCSEYRNNDCLLRTARNVTAKFDRNKLQNYQHNVDVHHVEELTDEKLQKIVVNGQSLLRCARHVNQTREAGKHKKLTLPPSQK